MAPSSPNKDSLLIKLNQPPSVSHELDPTATQQPDIDVKTEKRQLEDWMKQAEAGDAAAHYQLGSYYADQGQLSKAEFNLEQAANQGVVAALYSLASLYADPAIVLYDVQKSYHWALKAAEEKDANAMLLLYHLMPTMKTVPQSSFSHLDWLKRASILEHPEAQYLLGRLYEVGTDDVSRNLSRARQLYEKSAQQNHADAQFSLGMMYYHGQVLNPDYSQAFTYFLKAAQQDHVAAQYQIGAMYYTGQVSAISDKSLPPWYKSYMGRHSFQQHSSILNRNKMAYFWFGLANQGDHEEAEQMQLIVAHILDQTQIEILNELIYQWSTRGD